MELKQNILMITDIGEVNKALEQKIDLLKDTESQADFLMADWYTKDFELLIGASEFRIMTCIYDICSILYNNILCLPGFSYVKFKRRQ